MERRVSRVGCDGGGAKVDDVPAAVSALEYEEEAVISNSYFVRRILIKFYI